MAGSPSVPVSLPGWPGAPGTKGPHPTAAPPVCSGWRLTGGRTPALGALTFPRGSQEGTCVHLWSQSWPRLQRLRGLSLNFHGLWQVRAWGLHGCGCVWGGGHWVSQLQGGLDRGRDLAGLHPEGRRPCPLICLLPPWGLERLLLAVGRQFLTIQKPVGCLPHCWEPEIGRAGAFPPGMLPSPAKQRPFLLQSTVAGPLPPRAPASPRLRGLELLSGASGKAPNIQG